MTAITFGICGVGRIGQEHCQRFTQAKDKYRLVALCDKRVEQVSGLAEEHSCASHTCFEEFLQTPEMELAIIATPSLAHAQNAQQALAAGKIVLLEKPIGVTAEDYTLLQQLTREYPDRLFFGHNHRFEPAFENACEIIAAGLLGKVQVVKLCKHHVFMRRNDWQMRLDCGGGQLSVWGPHLIDQGLQLLGAPVRDIWSYLRSILTPGDGDDHVRITLIGENDVAVELEISNSVALAAPYCTIYGDRGTLQYGQYQKEIRLRYLDPKFQWPGTTADSGPAKAMSTDEELPWMEETRTVVPETNMWEQVEVEMVKHLYSAIRDNIPFPVTTADALEVVRVTEVVKKQNPQFPWIG